jgi:hypothetical protein
LRAARKHVRRDGSYQTHKRTVRWISGGGHENLESQALRNHSVSNSGIKSEETWREILAQEALREKRTPRLLQLHENATKRYV